MSLTNRQTPSSINSAAKIEFEIKSQGNPFDMLRIAENIIEEKEEALALAEISLEERRSKINWQKEQAELTGGIEAISLRAEIKRLSLELEKYERVKRDAEFELNIAKITRTHILKEYPTLKNYNYEQMQSIASYQAYLDNKANALIIAMLERSLGLPANLTEFLLTGDSDLIAQIQQKILTKLETLDQSLPSVMALLQQQQK